MIIYRYEEIEATTGQQPINNNLVWETAAGGLYLVDSDDGTKVYYSADEGETWTQIDVDPSNSSGDNKSRDQTIVTAWHEIIWFADCENDGVESDFDVWKLDYSSSESAPTVTEVSTTATDGACYVHDIFVYDNNTYLIVQDVNNLECYDVDSDPAVAKDDLDLGDWIFQSSYRGVLVGDRFYNIGACTTGSYIMGYSYDVGDDSLSLGGSSTQHINTTIPSASQNGISYDGSNLLMFCGDVSGTAKLISWSISGDAFTTICNYDVAIMIDRNTAS